MERRRKLRKLVGSSVRKTHASCILWSRHVRIEMLTVVFITGKQRKNRAKTVRGTAKTKTAGKEKKKK